MRVVAAFALMLAACSGGQPAPAASDQPTIVSLNPCADAILAEIAAPDQLLAISHYSHNPASSSMPADQAARFASTGGTAEEVLALAPDMVVADPFFAPATRRALEQAGIAVETIGIAGSLDDSLTQIAFLGQQSGNAERAERLSREIANGWSDASWPGEAVPTLLLQQGNIVPGEASLANAMLEHAGFASLSAARGLGQGDHLPTERVLADPPRVVITAGRGEVRPHPLLGDVEGVQHFELDPVLLYCGGLTIPRALQRLTQIRGRVQ